MDQTQAWALIKQILAKTTMSVENAEVLLQARVILDSVLLPKQDTLKSA